MKWAGLMTSWEVIASADGWEPQGQTMMRALGIHQMRKHFKVSLKSSRGSTTNKIQNPKRAKKAVERASL
jgi:hypothetical protein